MLSRFIEAVARWHKRRKDIANLEAMTDRQLADIGISRSEIHAVIYGGEGVRRAAPAAPEKKAVEPVEARPILHFEERHFAPAEPRRLSRAA